MRWCRRKAPHLQLIQTEIKPAGTNILGAFCVTPTPSWIDAVLEQCMLYN